MTQSFDFNETSEGTFDTKIDISTYTTSGKEEYTELDNETITYSATYSADVEFKTDRSQSNVETFSMDGWAESEENGHYMGIAAENYSFTSTFSSDTAGNHEHVVVSGKLGSNCTDGLVAIATEQIIKQNADADNDVLPYDVNMSMSGANSSVAKVVFSGAFSNTAGGNTATVTIEGQPDDIFITFTELGDSGLCIVP